MRGIEGLRVIDASVLPREVTGNVDPAVIRCRVGALADRSLLLIRARALGIPPRSGVA